MSAQEAESQLYLKTIDLRAFGKKVTDAELFLLATSLQFDIQHIVLEGCQCITDHGVIALVQAYPNLKSFDARNCFNVTDAAIIILAHSCPRLETIKLGFCQAFRDMPFVPIMVPDSPDVHIAYISSRISDHTLNALAAQCPRLNHISVGWCSEITKQAAQRLTCAHKNFEGCSFITPV